MSSEHDRPDEGGQDTGSGKVVHEAAARQAGRQSSWLRQLRRVLRLDKGRPYGQDSTRK